jgi:hypothetical protein
MKLLIINGINPISVAVREWERKGLDLPGRESSCAVAPG